MPDRVYLDWNATAPLRPEARAAMVEAMDVVGNPSSVHTEGRAAKMIVEKAREQVANLVGCDTEELVFTSGATEAAEQALSGEIWNVGSPSVEGVTRPLVLRLSNNKVRRANLGTSIEHECVTAHLSHTDSLKVYKNGQISWGNFGDVVAELLKSQSHVYVSIQGANSETGVLQSLEKFQFAIAQNGQATLFSDIVQLLGKSAYSFGDSPRVLNACASSHKIGGPKGAGALINRVGPWADVSPLIHGGGQEKGRRSGTENVIGIAGFGAAAEAAQRDLDAGAWEPIEELRDDLEAALRDCAGDDLTIFGESAPRLPNTSCFAIPGWKGETQVMQLDLAGFAVSAGSACSSGKVGPSRVLKAMGFDDITASSAIRVSMGPTTTKDEVSRFIDAWTGLYKRMKTRAA